MRDKTQLTEPVGRHLLVDFYGVESDVLRDEASLVKLLIRALEYAGFNIVDHQSHRFPGQQSGVTAIALLTESHATIHTYPEYAYAAIDVFSCGQPEPEAVVKWLADALEPSRVDAHEQPRGVQANTYDGLPRPSPSGPKQIGPHVAKLQAE